MTTVGAGLSVSLPAASTAIWQLPEVLGCIKPLVATLQTAGVLVIKVKAVPALELETICIAGLLTKYSVR